MTRHSPPIIYARKIATYGSCHQLNKTPCIAWRDPLKNAAVLRWLKGSSEEDALTRAIANGNQKAITAALKSRKVTIKKRE